MSAKEGKLAIGALLVLGMCGKALLKNGDVLVKNSDVLVKNADVVAGGALRHADGLKHADLLKHSEGLRSAERAFGSELTHVRSIELDARTPLELGLDLVDHLTDDDLEGAVEDPPVGVETSTSALGALEVHTTCEVWVSEGAGQPISCVENLVRDEKLIATTWWDGLRVVRASEVCTWVTEVERSEAGTSLPAAERDAFHAHLKGRTGCVPR